MKSFLLYLIPLTLIGIGAGIYFYKADEAGAGGKKRWGGGPTPVFAVQAENQDFTETIEGLGTVKANESTMLSSKVTGIVQQIEFEEGEETQATQVLVRLETEEEEAFLKEAEAVLLERKRQLERVTQLVNTGGISQSSLDEAQSAYETANARVNSLKTQIGDRILTAPFNGILGLRNISIGTLIRPGDPVVSIMDIAQVKIDFTLPEAKLSLIERGQSITASSIAYPDQIFTGTVQSIDSEVDTVTRAVTVRAIIQNPERKLLPGMLMNVELATIVKKSVAIPESALIPIGGKQYAFRINAENKAERIAVTIGTRVDGTVEIIEGINPGDTIITEGFKVRNGSEVVIKSKAEVFATQEEG